VKDLVDVAGLPTNRRVQAVRLLITPERDAAVGLAYKQQGAIILAKVFPLRTGSAGWFRATHRLARPSILYNVEYTPGGSRMARGASMGVGCDRWVGTDTVVAADAAAYNSLSGCLPPGFGEAAGMFAFLTRIVRSVGTQRYDVRSYDRAWRVSILKTSTPEGLGRYLQATRAGQLTVLISGNFALACWRSDDHSRHTEVQDAVRLRARRHAKAGAQVLGSVIQRH